MEAYGFVVILLLVVYGLVRGGEPVVLVGTTPGIALLEGDVDGRCWLYMLLLLFC